MARLAPTDDNGAEARVLAGAPRQSGVSARKELQMIEVSTGEAETPVSLSSEEIITRKLRVALVAAGLAPLEPEDDDVLGAATARAHAQR